MHRAAFLFLIAIPGMVSGCLGDDEKTKLVPSEPFGNTPSASSEGLRTTLAPSTSLNPRTALSPTGPVTKTSIRPAPAESAARVDLLGRNILAANPQIGMKPQFMVIGSPQPEIFHKKNEGLFITEALVKQCKTDGELAAVLCHELGKMVSDREVRKCGIRDGCRLRKCVSATTVRAASTRRIGRAWPSWRPSSRIDARPLLRLCRLLIRTSWHAHIFGRPVFMKPTGKRPNLISKPPLPT